MSRHTVQPDGGVPLLLVPFALLTERLMTAVDNLEEAAKAESNYPDTLMGKWVGVLRDVMSAFQMIDEIRGEQLRRLAKVTQAAAARPEADATSAQADHLAWIEAVSDRVADRVQAAMLIRAQARNRAEVFRTALLCTALLASVAWNGYNSSALNRCLDLPRQRQVGSYAMGHRSPNPVGREAIPMFPDRASLQLEGPKAERHPTGNAGWPL